MARYFFDVVLREEHRDESGQEMTSETQAVLNAIRILSDLTSDGNAMIEAGGAINVTVRRGMNQLITFTAARHSVGPTDKCEAPLRPELWQC